MAVPLSALKAKAHGTLEALVGMTAKQKDASPTPPFAEDFNKFRKLAIEAMPSIEPVAPAEIQINDQGLGIRFAIARYGEIEAYYRQIVALLDAEGGSSTWLKKLH